MKSKTKAVFLDRDGVINKEIGRYVYQVSDFEFNEGVFEALKKLSENGFLLILISNQGGIAKELYSVQDVDNLHRYMQDELQKKDIVLTDVYYCPHHPEKTQCLCRKPDSLLLEKAIAKYNIDIAESVLIGDQERDMEAARKIGLRGVKIPSNTDLRQVVEAVINEE